MTDAVTSPSAAFTQTDNPLPHGERAKRILAAHPDVRRLFEPNIWSALWTVLLVALQVAIGIGLAIIDAPWWAVMLAAYVIGAFANHALFVLIHDYTHNVVFKTANANRLGAIFANIAIVFPAAIGFRNYHLMHHKYLGIPGLDADVPTPREARWVGNSWWRKTFWLSMFWAVQGLLRPTTVKAIRTIDGWVVSNTVAMAAAMTPIVWFFGWWPVVYLFMSTVVLAWRAPAGRPLDPGALRVQRRAGDLFLLRPAEQTVVQHGLPQRAPRLPPCAVVTPPGGARRGAGVLRPSLPPPVVDQVAFPRTLQPQVRAAQPHRAAYARADEGRALRLTIRSAPAMSASTHSGHWPSVCFRPIAVICGRCEDGPCSCCCLSCFWKVAGQPATSSIDREIEEIRSAIPGDAACANPSEDDMRRYYAVPRRDLVQNDAEAEMDRQLKVTLAHLEATRGVRAADRLADEQLRNGPSVGTGNVKRRSAGSPSPELARNTLGCQTIWTEQRTAHLKALAVAE